MTQPLNREQFIRAVLADVADIEWQIVESEFLASRRASDDRESLSDSKAYVLVVDNDLLAAARVRAITAQRGDVCVVARNTDDARELCQALRFDCVFIDMQLAGESSLALATVLQGPSRPNFIVMMSGCNGEEYLAVLADGRINAYVQKPLSPALLEELLSQSLRRVET